MRPSPEDGDASGLDDEVPPRFDPGQRARERLPVRHVGRALLHGFIVGLAGRDGAVVRSFELERQLLYDLELAFGPDFERRQVLSDVLTEIPPPRWSKAIRAGRDPQAGQCAVPRGVSGRRARRKWQPRRGAWLRIGRARREGLLLRGRRDPIRLWRGVGSAFFAVASTCSGAEPRPRCNAGGCARHPIHAGSSKLCSKQCTCIAPISIDRSALRFRVILRRFISAFRRRHESAARTKRGPAVTDMQGSEPIRRATLRSNQQSPPRAHNGTWVAMDLL